LNVGSALRGFALVIGIPVIISAGPVQAEQIQIKQQNLSQGEIVEAHSYPWSSIAKLNNGIGGSCSAVLISQNYALTAAHCLFFRSTGRYLPAQSLHVILGYEKQHYQSHLLVSAYYVPPTYEPTRPYETLASDWALLSISGRQDAATHPLKPLQLIGSADNHLMTAGYSHRTPYLMTADRDCQLVGRSHDDNFLYDSCKAPAGYSGAPLLALASDGHTFSVAGIHVANQLWQAQTIAIAIPIETIWQTIKPCVEDNQCQFQFVADGKDPTAAEVLSGLPNLGVGSAFRLTASSSCSTKESNC
jgi:protease YdgD